MTSPSSSCATVVRAPSFAACLILLTGPATARAMAWSAARTWTTSYRPCRRLTSTPDPESDLACPDKRAKQHEGNRGDGDDQHHNGQGSDPTAEDGDLDLDPDLYDQDGADDTMAAAGRAHVAYG